MAGWRWYIAFGGHAQIAKVIISLPDRFLKEVDRVAGVQNRSRSELIREALRALLGGEQRAVPSWKKSLAP